jgi:hypothetical protein
MTSQKLNWKARVCLLYTSTLFWTFSMSDSRNLIFWTSRLVSICSFLNYVFYNNHSRGIIGQIDAFVVRVSGFHFVSVLFSDLFSATTLQDQNQNHFFFKVANLLVASSVLPLYLFRFNPNFQILVHVAALVALRMYVYQLTF